jgi:hypothetical protein
MASVRHVRAAAIAAAFSLTLAAAMAGAAVLCSNVDCHEVQAVLRPAGDSSQHEQGEGGVDDATITGSTSPR